MVVVVVVGVVVVLGVVVIVVVVVVNAVFFLFRSERLSSRGCFCRSFVGAHSGNLRFSN